MAHSQFDRFLTEATYRDQESGKSLDRDSLHGLHTSWCCVSEQKPQSEHAFWAAMGQRLSTAGSLRMKKCPAAADYILSSYQAVV